MEFACIQALKELPEVVAVAAVGSRVTNPESIIPHKTDHDFLVLVKNTYSRSSSNENLLAVTAKFAEEWDLHLEGDKHYADAFSNFCSLRGVERSPDGAASEINLIVTMNDRFYGKFMTATELCKALKLPLRSQRVDLFQYVIYERLPK